MIAGESGGVEIDKLPLNYAIVKFGPIFWVHLTSDQSQIVVDTLYDVSFPGLAEFLDQLQAARFCSHVSHTFDFNPFLLPFSQKGLWSVFAGEFGDVESDKLLLNFPSVNFGCILLVHITSDLSQNFPNTPESMFVWSHDFFKDHILQILPAIFSHLMMSLFQGSL